ncbi:MAG: HdeD family acid-resistance protein [Bacillota bacterium]
MRILTLAGGVLMVLTGAFCFINPGQTFMTMAFVIGSVMVINGLIHALGFLLARSSFGIGDNNGWILIDAVLTLLLGILILCNQLTVDIAIPMIFGMWVLVTGLLRFEASTRINRQKKPANFRAALITGVVTIIVGLFGFINPLITYVSVIVLLGIFMVVQGANSIELGINMPHKAKRDAVEYVSTRVPVKIGDDENESPEAVAERIRAQKEFEEKKEFTMAFGEGNFGLTKEEVEKAVQELKKE